MLTLEIETLLEENCIQDAISNWFILEREHHRFARVPDSLILKSKVSIQTIIDKEKCDRVAQQFDRYVVDIEELEYLQKTLG